MARTRVLTLVLLTSLGVVGVPFRAPVQAKSPATVLRDVSVEPGVVRTSAFQGAWLQRRVMTFPIKANLVGASFRSAATDEQLEELVLEARFRTATGWLPWERLTIEPDEAPDEVEARAGSQRVFTGPTWVGTADAAEVRYASPPGGATIEDLRFHLVNTLGNASDPGVFDRVVGAVSSFFQGSKAHAMTTQPPIITRAQWGADESIRECCPRYATSVEMAFVHHTVGPNSYSKSESPALVRGVYAYHVKNRGWSDIGYNFLVDRYGQVFEGRYGGMAEPVIGAHVKGFNTKSTGISLMGTFTTSSPTAAMVASLKNLLAWKLDVHNVPPIGTVVMTSGGSDLYPIGTKKTFKRISGHRDGQQTSCPGWQTYKLLPSIRTAVSKIGLSKLYLPRTNSTILRRDGDGVNEYVRVEGDFTTTINWTVTFRDAEGVSILKTFTGKGTKATAYWDGYQSDGKPARSGPIAFVIEGFDDLGRLVRPGKRSFFLVTNHPDGTVLKSPTKSVYIEEGKARPIPSAAVRDSWFRAPELVAATNAAIDAYPTGDTMTVREGAIFSNAGTYYMFSDGKLREFETPQVYADLHYTAASALPISDADLAGLPKGMKIDDALRHPAGAAVRTSDGITWTVGGASRSTHPSLAVRRSWYRDAEVVDANAGDIALLPGALWTYRGGAMLEPPDGTHWLYADGVRRGIETGLFEAMGYKDAASIPIPSGELSAIPDLIFGHYPPVGLPVVGDWNDDDDETPGAVRGNKWYLHDDADGTADHIFGYGLPGDRPVVGDWDGDGVTTPGIIRGNQWFLNNGFDGSADIVFAYGSAGDRVVIGDWDGDGTQTPGIVRGNVWYLNNDFDPYSDVAPLAYGSPSDLVVAGDWNGDGTDTPGIVRGNVWYLNDDFDQFSDVTPFAFGSPTDTFVAGDWDGDGETTPGVVRIWTWLLRNTNTAGVADESFIDLG
ncbi:MAG: N-acetylmuramoyl-L-alanine amidase [Actinomycetota bacterium]